MSNFRLLLVELVVVLAILFALIGGDIHNLLNRISCVIP